MNSTDDTHAHKDNPSWLEKLSRALLREPQDREQLISLIRNAESRDLLDSDSLSMIEGVLQVSELQARDIMIPRAQMASVREVDALEEFIPAIIQTGHSRFPILDEDNKVIGIIHAKDLLRYYLDAENFELRDILRPANFIPQSRSLDKLLKDFRRTRNHMAVVVDEYGEIAGIITIEDIIEQIIGEIADEFDVTDDAYIKKHTETDYIIKALTPIEDFNAYFSTELDEEEFDTIGGLVTHHFGHVPTRNETITIDNFEFKVLNADRRHIRLLKVTIKPQSIPAK